MNLNQEDKTISFTKDRITKAKQYYILLELLNTMTGMRTYVQLKLNVLPRITDGFLGLLKEEKVHKKPDDYSVWFSNYT